MHGRHNANNNRKKGGQAQQPQKQQPSRPRMPSVYDDTPIPRVIEPRPVCPICGEPIEAIIEAITEPDGTHSHFDCVLKRLAEQYEVVEPDKVSYIGQGNFAVVTRDAEGKYTIKEKIPYESAKTFDEMKKYVEEQKQ